MNHGLSDETILKLQLLFSKYNVIEEVILYGSRAMGTYREGSDIDLTVMGEDIDPILIFKIQSDYDDLLLPYKMDLSMYTSITNDELKDHIRRVGKLFYEKKANN